MSIAYPHVNETPFNLVNSTITIIVNNIEVYYIIYLLSIGTIRMQFCKN